MTPLQQAAQQALHQMAMENWNWASTTSNDTKRSVYVELQKALTDEQAQTCLKCGAPLGEMHMAAGNLKCGWPGRVTVADCTKQAQAVEPVAGMYHKDGMRRASFGPPDASDIKNGWKPLYTHPAPPPATFQDELVTLAAIALYELQEATGCDTAAQFKAQQVAVPAEQQAVTSTLPERDATRPAEQQGLFRKFVVQRNDGSDKPGGKHHNCEYFVLDVTHDSHAPAALRAYAESCALTHPALASDLVSKWGAQQVAVPELLSAWLQWCLDNCDDSPEYNFGTDATDHMRAILAGKPAPMPPAQGAKP